MIFTIDLMIRAPWDLGPIAARYEGFHTRWEAWRAGPGDDPVVTRLRLVSEWLGVIRTDPRLPVRHLPPDWPAHRAETAFHRIAAETEAPARRMAADLLDITPCDLARPVGGPAARPESPGQHGSPPIYASWSRRFAGPSKERVPGYGDALRPASAPCPSLPRKPR